MRTELVQGISLPHTHTHTHYKVGLCPLPLYPFSPPFSPPLLPSLPTFGIPASVARRWRISHIVVLLKNLTSNISACMQRRDTTV